MRPLLVAIFALALPVAPLVQATAQVSINIGVNVPAFPDLVPVPGYPVYYDPFIDSNYFFYDGQYWVYDNDYWYTSDWYNGPWQLVEPDYVPIFLLRVPVRYYRRPPTYFGGWLPDRPPRWEEHWGRNWEDHHRGWNHWNHKEVPRPAPLPTYQRQFAGDRYPRPEEQHSLRQQHYQYKPHEQSVRQLRQDHSQQDRQINQRVDKPLTQPATQSPHPPVDRATNPSAPARHQVPPPRSQPLPEHPPEFQHERRRPDNSQKPPEEFNRPPLKRPDAPPTVQSHPTRPTPPQQSTPMQRREEPRQPSPQMQRPQPHEVAPQREPPRQGPPPREAQHPPQREAKKPPHRDDRD